MSDVVIVVKARIFREGLLSAIKLRNSQHVVAAHACAAEVIEQLRRQHSDILIVDTSLSDAFELLALARVLAPRVKVIALAVNSDDEQHLLKWAEAGVAGLVTCDNSIDELLASIETVLVGEYACSARVSAALLRRVAQLAALRGELVSKPLLTPRQTLILQLLRMGLSNKQIARDLGIELATVKNHVHQLLQRMGVTSRREAAASSAVADRGMGSGTDTGTGTNTGTALG